MSPIVGSVLVDGDCDDNNAAVNPSATEICNLIDDDCDGLIDEGVFLTFYADVDGDGFGDASSTTQACSAPVGYVTDNTDCDDNNAAVNPSATEICNGIDDDCNGLSDDGLVFLDYYVDADGDGFGAGVATSSCNPIVGSVLVDGDCDDNNAAVNPGASEICNGIDDDCNGLSDDGLVFLDYYVDADGDGFGAGVATSSCSPIVGSVLVDGDCDDNNAAVNPSATEVCNLIDDDCDGLIDEGVLLTFYADVDGDGFGDASSTTQACSAPVGYVTDNTDCDDNNAAVNPGASEICNGIDDDCNGLSDDGLVFLDYYVDADGDGFGAGVATSSCNPIVGSVLVDGDCDDNNAAVNPGATEICNGIDDDCNGLSDDGLVFLDYYVDADGDGFGAGVATSSCSPIVGSVLVDGDCDDNNAAVNPSATEVCGNGIDDNCDSNIDEGCILYTYFADTDNDSYGDPLSFVSNYVSTPPVGYVSDNTDCNDNNAAVNPGATEVCNLIDDDCDGLIDEGVLFTFYADADGDGFGDASSSIQACSAPVGYVFDNNDCNDGDATIHPGATELCNLIDDDCDGIVDNNIVITLGTITGQSQACIPIINGSAVYTAPNTPGVTNYFWTVPNGMTITSGQGTTTLAVSWTAQAVHSGINGQISLTASTTCGTVVPSILIIDFNYAAPVTPASISGPAKICPGDVAIYSIANVARASSYNWTTPAGVNIISGQGTNVLTVSINNAFAGGSIGVNATNTCGTGPVRMKTVSYNVPNIPAPITGNKNGLCGATNVTFSTAGSPNATGYLWTVPTGVTIVSGQGTSMINVDVSGGFVSGLITVTGTNNCGSGSQRSLSIIGAPGQPGIINGLTNVCPGQSGVQYDVATVTGATNYTWSVPGGATIVSGQGTKTIIVNFGANPANNQVVSVRKQCMWTEWVENIRWNFHQLL
ncbi:MAG: putative metal-binding motif-containing protein [Bacteroidetes bacterium]|nr:putative metal-binding motif-containing protein [Bacteroidota bacterium]